MMGKVNESQHIKVSVHTAVYRWALPLVSGKRVLDAGCGTGYGAAILAERAKGVVGVDKDAAVVAEAAKARQGENIEYHVMDCRALAFDENSFDVVFSNALIELLEDYGAFMAEVQRVLKPGGVFVCGTKNFNLSFKRPDRTPLYGGHVHEFTSRELCEELESRFECVSVYGELMRPQAERYMMNQGASTMEYWLVKLKIKHCIPLRLRNFVRRLVTGVGMAEITADDFEVVEGEFDNCWYIVGCGTKSGN